MPRWWKLGEKSHQNRKKAEKGAVQQHPCPSILKEQREGGPTAEAVTEGFREVALARNAQELLFGPGKEGRDLWLAQLLARGMADVSGLPIDVALDALGGVCI